MTHPILITITGPSGSGKTVLSNLLAQNGCRLLIGTTTRSPRQGEQNGVDYHFVDRNAFEKKITMGDFFEFAEYNGNYYGSEISEIKKASSFGTPLVKVVEPKGVVEIDRICQERDWGLIRIFVTNPISILLERVLERFATDCEGLDRTSREGEIQFREKKSIYASRIQAMTQFEHQNWVVPAISNEGLYDLVFQEFNQEKQAEVLTAIKGYVQRKGFELSFSGKPFKP